MAGKSKLSGTLFAILMASAGLGTAMAEFGGNAGLLPAGTELAAIYVLFPDPWPKARHHKHRLLQPEFLGAIARRAGLGTRLYFRTDHEPYFVDTAAALRSHPDWQLVDEPWPFEERTVFQARAPSFRSLVATRK